MNIYYVRNSYVGGRTGIIVTDKPRNEVQDIIDKAISKDENDRYNNMLDAFKENGITFIHDTTIYDVEF